MAERVEGFVLGGVVAEIEPASFIPDAILCSRVRLWGDFNHVL